MAKKSQRLCYVLPEYSSSTSSHLYHTWELIEDLAQKIRIYLFVERATEPPKLKSADHIYVQRFTLFPFRLLERFFMLLLIRLRGYRDF